MKRALLIFLKFPSPGSVKTRLAQTLGPDLAAQAYKWLVSKVFAQVSLAPANSFHIHILFDPPNGDSAVRSWLAPDLHTIRQSGAKIRFLPQADGDLGRRLSQGFASAFADGFQRVAAIGTDCIAITPHHIDQAWSLLDSSADAVFGPASDGGYYLVALSAPHPELFQYIPWSQADTLEKSLRAASSASLNVAQLETLDDVDEAEDWERVRPDLGSSPTPPS